MGKPETCPSCGFFAAEVLTPVGDGCRTLCYDCAHYVTAHDHVPGADIAGCDCPREVRYPRSYIERSDAIRAGRVRPPETELEAHARRYREAGETRKLEAEAYLGRLARGADAIAARGDGTGTRRGYGKRPPRSAA